MQTDREIAEMIAKFRTPPGMNWGPLADDIETLISCVRRQEQTGSFLDARYAAQHARSSIRRQAARREALEEAAKIAEGARVADKYRDSFSLEEREARDHTAHFIAMQIRGIAAQPQ